MATAGPVAGDRFGGLDALRGAAALAILVFHTIGIYAGGQQPDAVIQPWVARMEVGVPVFFLLSGFLLYRPFVRARADGLQPRPVAYAWRRALRIVPGYWVALLFAAIVLGLGSIIAPRYLFFAQAYDRETVAGGLPQAWTLCIEVAFYALLPLWAWLVRRRELTALAGLAAFSIAWKLWVLESGRAGDFVSATEPWMIALPAYLDMFAAGMAVAVVSTRRAIPGTVLQWWSVALAFFVIAAVGSGLDAVDPRGYSHAEALTRHWLYLAVALCVLLGGVVWKGEHGAVAGRLSYGIYLYHLTVLSLLSNWNLVSLQDEIHPYLLWGVPTLTATLLLATASWYLVERPALSLKRLAGPPLRPAPAAPPPSG